MTTIHAPNYRLPRAATVAATLQLAGLALLSWVTTVWAWLIVAFTSDDSEHAQTAAGLLTALLIGLPAPVATVALVAAMVRVRRRGAPPLVRFEIATCVAVGALLVAGLLGASSLGEPATWVGLLAGVGAPFVVYAGLAAAVIVSIRRQTRRALS